jgi:hypothetical protein
MCCITSQTESLISQSAQNLKKKKQEDDKNKNARILQSQQREIGIIFDTNHNKLRHRQKNANHVQR